MKKKLVLFCAAIIATVSLAGAQGLNIQGTWKLLERNGNRIPAQFTQLKMITASHFMWTIADSKGNIINGAGGTYTLEGNKYTETITRVLPNMKRFYEYKPVFEISVEGNKLTQKGNMLSEEITEIWEKID